MRKVVYRTKIRFPKERKPKNLLWRTRTYLIGHMENVSATEGETWRDQLTPELEKMGVVVFNPYYKPFINEIDESPESRDKRIALRNRGKFKKVCEDMRVIRSFDLSLVDRADFIIAHIKPNIASWGTADEFLTANRMKKPIFLSVEGGKKNCPLWLLGVIPAKYIYDTPQDILKVIKKIDSGKKHTDSSRWRLLRKEYR